MFENISCHCCFWTTFWFRLRVRNVPQPDRCYNADCCVLKWSLLTIVSRLTWHWRGMRMWYTRTCVRAIIYEISFATALHSPQNYVSRNVKGKNEQRPKSACRWHTDEGEGHVPWWDWSSWQCIKLGPPSRAAWHSQTGKFWWHPRRTTYEHSAPCLTGRTESSLMQHHWYWGTPWVQCDFR